VALNSELGRVPCPPSQSHPLKARNSEPPVSGPLFRFLGRAAQMPTDYEHEADYRGPEPSWESIAIAAAVLAGTSVSLLYLVVEWWS
jgi:hypothetical protein